MKTKISGVDFPISLLAGVLLLEALAPIPHWHEPEHIETAEYYPLPPVAGLTTMMMVVSGATAGGLGR